MYWPGCPSTVTAFGFEASRDFWATSAFTRSSTVGPGLRIVVSG